MRVLTKHITCGVMGAVLLGASYRAQALDKPSQGNPGTALHQDAHFIRNEPNTLMACWVAMSDTDGENGGLCVVPGSHLRGLREVSKNEDEDHVTWETEHLMRDPDGREWQERFFSFKIPGLEMKDVVQLEVPVGDGVFFSGLIIHGSFANRAQNRPRRAFAIHYVREGTWVFRDDIQRTVPVDPAKETASLHSSQIV